MWAECYALLICIMRICIQSRTPTQSLVFVLVWSWQCQIMMCYNMKSWYTHTHTHTQTHKHKHTLSFSLLSCVSVCVQACLYKSKRQQREKRLRENGECLRKRKREREREESCVFFSQELSSQSSLSVCLTSFSLCAFTGFPSSLLSQFSSCFVLVAFSFMMVGLCFLLGLFVTAVAVASCHFQVAAVC